MTASDWLAALAAARDGGEVCVLVTVVEAEGSTPRAAGTKMVVFADRIAGTIGGGHLEFEALRTARRLLTESGAGPRMHDFPLGPALGQCCGGRCKLLFEPMVPTERTLLLFGAGHVARALVPVLEDLPFRIRWIDERREAFPAAVPANATVELTGAPDAEIDEAPPGALYLVMTHSHDLDQRLVAAVLRRGDFAWLGLIGSTTKRARFEKRLKADGLDPSRLVCPIGLAGVPGKHPKAIAVAVAAQLLAEAAH
ncbi:MAG TPA: xanthine dehydrogenase accessory protein XdhC [Alphaproteobacteria bacterium]|nr:xanthine dehydrogenase accessory protein XdhC [Alphaproteobacteria bacterium]